MRKFFVLGLTLWFGHTLVSAQNFAIGPELGTNVIQLQKTDMGRDFRLGWYAGVQTSYDFNDYFGLQTGAYFSQRHQYSESFDTSQLSILGFNPSDLGISGVDFSVYDQSTEVITLYGIEIPVTASFKLGPVSFFAGPYVNFMVRAWHRKTKDTTIPFLQTFDIDSLDPSGFLSALFPPAQSTVFTESSSKDNLRIFDYGFRGGCSYWADSFGFKLWYNFGIPDYRLDRGANTFKSNSYFTTSIVYQFHFGKTSRSSFGD